MISAIAPLNAQITDPDISIIPPSRAIQQGAGLGVDCRQIVARRVAIAHFGVFDQIPGKKSQDDNYC
jgi:hypothetical protein